MWWIVSFTFIIKHPSSKVENTCNITLILSGIFTFEILTAVCRDNELGSITSIEIVLSICYEHSEGVISKFTESMRGDYNRSQ